MEPWMTLWTVLLFGSLLVFAVVAVVVSVGGLFDLRALFAALRREDDGDD